MSNQYGQWLIAPRLSAEGLRRYPDIHPLIIQLLANRGIRDDEEIRSFLIGGSGETHDPFLLKGVSEAVTRISEAVVRRELIAVHGDFDADGLTATALLIDTLTGLGAKAQPFIPQREDGYGLNVKSLAELAQRGVKLLVTVDCGISAAPEIASARELGMDVIVTDHHRVTGPLPEAHAVINPRQEDCRYPYKSLAGVGVAFKLAQALLSSLPVVDGKSTIELERSLLDLVALGTVADVVPLLGENRVLACKGLQEINRTTRPGLRALITSSGLHLGSIGSWDIGYTLGPRLNAAGRLGDARISYQMLTCGAEEAPIIARQIEDANRERQRITEEALLQARADVSEKSIGKVLVVASSEYPHGILGLVAGRLAEEYHRPAFVLGIDGAEARGSVRSIPEFDVASALGECRDLLVRFGGHARAAGFTVKLDNLDAFQLRLASIADSLLTETSLVPILNVDAELNLRGVDWKLFEQIQKVGPFGYDNTVPIFVSRKLQVVNSRVVGQYAPGHLRLTLSDGANRWNAIGFGMGKLLTDLPECVDIAYTIDQDTWLGGQTLQLKLKGIRPAQV